jgi:hypothetical protein
MESDSHLRTALAALAGADLDLKLDHILGLPGEPIEAQELARELYAEFTPRRIQTFWLVHLPGVELTKAAVERGDLSQEDYDAINRGEVRRYHAGGSDRLDDGQARLYQRYELLFRLMTVVPKAVVRRLRVEQVPDLPPAVSHLLGLVLEAVNAVLNRDDETRAYLRFYALHLRKLGRRRSRTGGGRAHGPTGPSVDRSAPPPMADSGPHEQIVGAVRAIGTARGARRHPVGEVSLRHRSGG